MILHESVARRLAQASAGMFEVLSPPAATDALEWLEEHGAGCRVLVTIGFDKVDAAVLDRLPDLRHIQVFGAGMDGIDLGEVARRGITIENSGAVHAGEVADFAMALMLAARRNLLEAERWVREERWASEGWFKPSRSMVGAKIGIVGLGHIGEAIARRVEPFSPDIRWWGPRAKPDLPWPRCELLSDLARWADILFVAVRAHDDTSGLITREIIEAVGPDGLIVNVSRGFVIDEDALIAALGDGRLGQAALDVFATEPTPAARWRDVPNVVLAPHTAGSTTESAIRLQEHIIARLRAFFGV